MGRWVDLEVICSVADAGGCRVELRSLLIGGHCIGVIIHAAVGISQPIPRDCLICIGMQQVNALLIEQDGLGKVPLCEIGQRQVAVRDAEERIELDGLVVGIDRLLECAPAETGISFFIPLQSIHTRYLAVCGLGRCGCRTRLAFGL